MPKITKPLVCDSDKHAGIIVTIYDGRKAKAGCPLCAPNTSGNKGVFLSTELAKKFAQALGCEITLIPNGPEKSAKPRPRKKKPNEAVIDATQTVTCLNCGKTDHPNVSSNGTLFCRHCNEKIKPAEAAKET
jgi:ribosomal protein L37AE/L43A